VENAVIVDGVLKAPCSLQEIEDEINRFVYPTSDVLPDFLDAVAAWMNSVDNVCNIRLMSQMFPRRVSPITLS